MRLPYGFGGDWASIELGDGTGYVKLSEYENLRELVREMYPYVGETCPEECKYRDECEGEDNRGTDGFPLMCVAYNRIGERLHALRIEVWQ